MSSTIIDVVIGLALVYLIFSLACMVILEWHTRRVAARSKQLHDFVKELIGHEISQELFTHPLIERLKTKDRAFPSYVPPRLFALALMNLTLEDSPDGLKPRNELPDKLRTLMATLVAGTRGSFQHAQERIERWFAESTERLSGYYTRYAQQRLLFIAIPCTLLLNIDTIVIARELNRNPVKAQAAVALAGKVTPPSAKDAGSSLNDLAPAFARLDLPMGWPDTAWLELHAQAENTKTKVSNWDIFVWGASKFAGLLLTICALSLGAPFWFDALNRIAKIRQTGTKPLPS